MEETFVPFRGIKNDLQGRLLCYKQDWAGGLRAGFRYAFLLPSHICMYLMTIGMGNFSYTYCSFRSLYCSALSIV